MVDGSRSGAVGSSNSTPGLSGTLDLHHHTHPALGCHKATCVKKVHLSNTSVDFSEQVAQDAHLSFLKKGLCCSQHCYQSSGTNKRVAHLQGAFPPVSSQLTKKPMLFKSKTGWQIHACALLCSCLSLLLQSCLKNDGIIIYFLAQTI